MLCECQHEEGSHVDHGSAAMVPRGFCKLCQCRAFRIGPHGGERVVLPSLPKTALGLLEFSGLAEPTVALTKGRRGGESLHEASFEIEQLRDAQASANAAMELALNEIVELRLRVATQTEAITIRSRLSDRIRELEQSWEQVDEALAYDEFQGIEQREDRFIVSLRHGAEGEGSTVREAFAALHETLWTPRTCSDCGGPSSNTGYCEACGR